MKKIYNTPECEIQFLQNEDIVMLSNGQTFSEDPEGYIWNYR